MLVLEGKSRNRSVLQMGSIKAVYWLCTGPHALLHLPISNARRGFPRHGDVAQDYSNTDERATIRR